ncbi:Lef-8 protein [Dolichomitus sp. PSUC_FEM 10030005]|nr:Lef-8 protein [Dolichomitus sp. PSUC_FEM 10030005]
MCEKFCGTDDYFLMQQLRDYNTLVRHHENDGDVIFNICPENALYATCYFLTKKINFFNHSPLTICYYQNISYCACITYVPENIHVCNLFPVLLGSDLDLQLTHTFDGVHKNNETTTTTTTNHHNLSKQNLSRCTCRRTPEEYRQTFVNLEDLKNLLDNKDAATDTADTIFDWQHIMDTTDSPIHNFYDAQYLSNCFGYFCISGRFCWLPYLLTNNRDLIHLSNTQSITQRTIKNKRNYNTIATSSRTNITEGSEDDEIDTNDGDGDGVNSDDNDDEAIEDRLPKRRRYNSKAKSRKKTTATTAATMLKNNTAKEKNVKCYVKYIYTAGSRGHALSFDPRTDTLTHRDDVGVNHVDNIGTRLASSEIVASALSSKHVYWNVALLKRIFKLQIVNVRPIDTLSNKLIISPAILISRLVIMGRSNPNLATQILYSGNWTKLLSLTATFKYQYQQKRYNIVPPACLRISQQNQQQQHNYHQSNNIEDPVAVATATTHLPVVSPSPSLSTQLRNVRRKKLGKLANIATTTTTTTTINATTIDASLINDRTNSINKVAPLQPPPKNSPKIEKINMPNVSNMYKNPGFHQLANRRNFGQVTRATSSASVNWSISIEGYQGFLCLLEKGINIDSFNKPFALVDDVDIHLPLNIRNCSERIHVDGGEKSGENLDGYPALDELIDILVSRTSWLHCHQYQCEQSLNICLDSTQYYLCFNGGIPAKYYCIFQNDTDFSNFFFYIKSLNPYVEICKSEKLVVLNYTMGIPFKRIIIGDKRSTCNDIGQDNMKFDCAAAVHGRKQGLLEIFLSPYELSVYFKDFQRFYTLFGAQCPESVITSIHNARVTKLLYGIYYMKNRLSSIVCLQLFPFSTDNTATYVRPDRQSLTRDNNDASCAVANCTDDKRKNDINEVIENTNNDDTLTTTSTMFSNNSDMFFKFKTLFAVDPFCTQDAYLLNSKWNSQSTVFVMLKRHACNIVYSYNDTFIVANNSGYSSSCKVNGHRRISNLRYRSGDARGHHSKLVYLGELQSSRNIVRFIKNQKIQTFTVNHGNSRYSHYFYIFLDSRCYLEAKSYRYEIVAHISPNVFDPRTASLSIECVFQTTIDSYDGLKLCNYCSQKGLANKNLNLNKRYAKLNPDIVASPFSLIGRAPVPQILELLKNPLDDKKLYGYCLMAILRNVSADHRNVGQMRFDNLSLNMLQMNCVCVGSYHTLQGTISEACDKYKPLPPSNRVALSLLCVTKKNIEFTFDDNTKDDLYHPAKTLCK